MTVKDFEEYFDFETMVTIKTKDGSKYTGINNDFETNSGYDEVELDLGSYYLDIDIRDITSVTKTAQQ